MRTTFIALIVFSLASACTDLLKSSRINPQTVAVYPGGQNFKKKGPDNSGCRLTQAISDSNDGAIDLDCFRFPEDTPSTITASDRTASTGTADNNTTRKAKNSQQGDLAYDRAAGPIRAINSSNTPSDAELESARIARNRLGAILVKQADDICTVEKGRLVRSETGVNFLLGLLTTSLSAAATIVTGEKAKTILSGIATTSSGTQNNFNATFYKNQLTQAITKSMDVERTRLVALIIGAQSQPTSTYTVDDMIRQINQYHHSCSFEHGLQLLLDKSVDASGANAALQTRVTQSAIVDLNAQVKNLEGKLTPLSSDNELRPQLIAQIKELRDKIQALVIAGTVLRANDPNAAQDAPTVKQE